MSAITPWGLRNKLQSTSAYQAFKRHNMAAQFWLYETGNVIAAIGGAGGVVKVSEDLSEIAANPDLTIPQQILEVTAHMPDATTAIGIGALAVGTPMARRTVRSIGDNAVNIVDGAATATGIGILGYALTQDASFIAQAAAFFVVGSAFLKGAMHNPFLLKIGGLCLAGGGVCLSLFGGDSLVQNGIDLESIYTYLDLSLVGTGAYVALASTKTYEGGIYKTMDYKAAEDKDEKPSPSNTLFSRLAHPTKGWLSKLFERNLDKPIQALNNLGNKALLFYVPQDTLNKRPFATSAWARVPWRFITGGLAAVAGKPELAFANGLWAGGDTAIASIDAPDLSKKDQNADQPRVDAA